MKKTAAIISACALTFALSACSGNNYGMISYKDANGNKQQINRSDVKEMKEIEH